MGWKKNNENFSLVFVQYKCIMKVQQRRKHAESMGNAASLRSLLPDADIWCTPVSTRWSRGVSNTERPWLFSPAAAPTWSGGRSWTGRPPPDATRTCPAGSPISSTAAAWRCGVIVLQRVNLDCFGHFHLTAHETVGILPLRLKYRFECRPESANWEGRGPSSSMMWAIWSESRGGDIVTKAQWSSTERLDSNLLPGRKWPLLGGRTDNPLLPVQKPEHMRPRLTLTGTHASSAPSRSHTGEIMGAAETDSPYRRCSRCLQVCRSLHRSEPPPSGTDTSGCPRWSVGAENRRETPSLYSKVGHLVK